MPPLKRKPLKSLPYLIWIALSGGLSIRRICYIIRIGRARYPGKHTESSEIWQLRLTSSRKLLIFVNGAMEVHRNKSFGRQSDLSLPIKTPSTAIKLLFRKETKLLRTPRRFVKYLMHFLRRWQIISGLMTPYHPTITPMKDFRLSLNDIVTTPV